MLPLDRNILLFLASQFYGDKAYPVLGCFPMFYWKYREKRPGSTKTGILVAILGVYDEDGRLAIHFTPGSTGHESYLFDADFIQTVKDKPLKVPLPDGQTVFPWNEDSMKDARWTLCAGSDTYAVLEVGMAAMKAMVAHFQPLAERWEEDDG